MYCKKLTDVNHSGAMVMKISSVEVGVSARGGWLLDSNMCQFWKVPLVLLYCHGFGQCKDVCIS